MRLTPAEVNGAIFVLDGWLPTTQRPAALYLYGSRTRDDLRGGDIDLAWVVPKPGVHALATHKHEILAALKRPLGDQRIDFSVLTEHEVVTDPFWRGVLPTAICLHRW